MSNIDQISSILNAPKWKFKEPNRVPPKLDLNSYNINTKKSFKETQSEQRNRERSCFINNCSFSTNSESEEEYQTKSNIFNLIVKRSK